MNLRYTSELCRPYTAQVAMYCNQMTMKLRYTSLARSPAPLAT